MAIDYKHLKNRAFAPVHQHYAERETMLYALSLGLGNYPLDAAALPFVYEGLEGGLRALPTQAVVLGYPGFWAREPDTGIDWVKLMHGEQRVRWHQPLPASGAVVGKNRVTHLIDKGEGKGAILVIERQLESATGELLATLQQVTFLRGDGGYSQLRGGQPSDAPLPALQPTPEDRAPDFTDTQSTRPEARNALSMEMRPALAAAIAQMRDDAQVHTVILTGAGGAFCSGGDISAMQDPSRTGLTFRNGMRELHQWFPELVNLEKPVIAAVDGPAFGAGLSLALAADFVLATGRAKFCAVFGRIGLVPDLGALHLLPRIVGHQKAKELVFTARTVDAAEAKQLGMVYDIVDDATALTEAALALARRFGQASTAAIGMAKTIMNQSFESDARTIAELESYAQAMCRGSAYHQDAVQRFKAKEPLRFDWDKK